MPTVDNTATSDVANLRRLTRATVAAFQLTNPEIDHPEDGVWRRIVLNLQADQGRLLARSMADTLTAIDGTTDDDRVQLVLRLASSLDIVEMIGAALYVSANRRSFDALLTAASLAQSPAVSRELHRQVSELGQHLEMSESQQDLLKVVLDPGYEPSRLASRRVRAVRWPGLAEPNRIPIIALWVTKSAPAGCLWLLAGELAFRGISIRRAFPDVSGDSGSPWLPSNALHLGWDERAPSPRLVPYMQLPAELFSPSVLGDVLKRVADMLRALDYSDVSWPTRSLLLSEPAENPRQKEAQDPQVSYQWSRYTLRLTDVVFSAVTRTLTDEVRMGAIKYEALMNLGATVARADPDFEKVIARTSHPGGSTLDEVISDAVAAAVSELIKQGAVRWNANEHELELVP